MLERPDLPDEKLAGRLQEAYGLVANHLSFLPLGADPNTAAYRAVAGDAVYFVKLRRGAFDETVVTLPKFLTDQGVEQIIPPLPAADGRLWTDLDAYKLIVYPFVNGHDGYEVELTEGQWLDFGRTLRRIHDARLPAALAGRMRRETYTPQWRESVRAFLERVETDVFAEPVAARTAALLRAKRAEILDLAGRAESCARILQTQALPFVVCHSDLHAGNVLIDDAGALYIVDWDDPILAPKERDLMYPGGGQGFIGRAPNEEEALFYRGYGRTEVNPVALAYYRYERIVQDIAAYCEQLLLSEEGGDDRGQSFRYLASNFLPGGTIEIAYRAAVESRDVGGCYRHP